MRDGKNKFYRALKLDKTTWNAIKLFRKIKYLALRSIPNKRKRK